MQSKSINILVCRETRAGETRVALIPTDVETLIQRGHTVFVEHDAGLAAGFSDQDYEKIGARIRFLNGEDISAYQEYFRDINMVVRAKRPERKREILENSSYAANTILIGSLDPYEKNSTHIKEYHQARITAYSIDQLNLPADDPMNLLAAMSKIAGKLALRDGIRKFNAIALGKSAERIVIIGFGIAGQAAFTEALNQALSVIVFMRNAKHIKEIEDSGGKAILLDKKDTLRQQQEIILNILADADVTVTSARSPKRPSPILIPLETLKKMQKGSVIVDLALSEGGNVEGSKHDATVILGNGIIVTNTSGYPKAMPHDASKLWSHATLLFILNLLGDEKDRVQLLPC